MSQKVCPTMPLTLTPSRMNSPRQLSSQQIDIQITNHLFFLDNLNKTKITGDKNVDAVQDGVNKGVTGQFEEGGALEGVGNLTSKEVFTRSERQGKNDKGGYL